VSGRPAAGPARGEVWQAELDPVRALERAGIRPVLVVSTNPFNTSPAGLVMTVPVTRTMRPIRSHVPVSPPEGGLSAPSVVMCEQVRTISVERLRRRRGAVSAATLRQVEDRLRILLEL